MKKKGSTCYANNWRWLVYREVGQCPVAVGQIKNLTGGPGRKKKCWRLNRSLQRINKDEGIEKTEKKERKIRKSKGEGKKEKNEQKNCATNGS